MHPTPSLSFNDSVKRGALLTRRAVGGHTCRSDHAAPTGSPPVLHPASGSALSLILVFAAFLSLTAVIQAQDKPPPTRQDAAWTAAGREFSRSRWSQAETAYTEFRRDFGIDERAVEALYRIGVCRQKRNNRDGAIAAWRDVLRSPANRPAERTALLRALGALFAILDPERDRHERDQILARLLRDFPDEKATTVRLHIAEGRRRIETGDFTAATRLFSAVEPHLGDLDRQFLQLARAHAGRGALDPGLVMKLADDRLTANETVLAAKLYDLALTSKPTPEQEREIRTKLGWALYLQGEHKDAERHWRQVLDNSPAGDAWRGRSRWHLIVLSAGVQNDVKRAVALCKEQSAEFKGSFLGEQALFSQAWMLKIVKDWQASKTAFDELAATYPRRAQSPPVQKYIAEVEAALEAKRKR